jgi:hypothetical protein
MTSPLGRSKEVVAGSRARGGGRHRRRCKRDETRVCTSTTTGDIRRRPSTTVVPWSGGPPAEAEVVASRVRGGDLQRRPCTTDLSSGCRRRREPRAAGERGRAREEQGGERLGCKRRTIS